MTTFRYVRFLLAYQVQCLPLGNPSFFCACHRYPIAGNSFIATCACQNWFINIFYHWAPPENIHTPLREGIGISLGVGGSARPKNLKKCVKLYWNFQRGGGLLGKIPSVGEVWTFSGITQWKLWLVANCKLPVKNSIKIIIPYLKIKQLNQNHWMVWS